MTHENKDLPLNFSVESVEVMHKLISHAMEIVTRRGMQIPKTMGLAKSVLDMLDPVCLDGKIRKDRTVDFMVSQSMLAFLALQLAAFESHEHHHHVVGCRGYNKAVKELQHCLILHEMENKEENA